MLEHGGQLRLAASHYRIALADWLDLSTGINPAGYPVPPLPEDVWRRLPEDDDGLEVAAANYYGSPALLPVAGSQAAIQALPTLLPGERVTLLTPTYGEHAHAWRGRSVRQCRPEQIDAAIANTDILVLSNPNNPCGSTFTPEQLLDWHRRLTTRNAWLIVDEAFVDATPDASVAKFADRPGLVVLRSPGKFFGLAGARGGFVFAPATLRAALAEHLGPWTVSGPARHALRAALADRDWQVATREQLTQDASRLAALLTARGFSPHGTALFQRVLTPHADMLADRLAAQGVLVRHFSDPAALRFGLPDGETAWARLAGALDTALNGIRP